MNSVSSNVPASANGTDPTAAYKTQIDALKADPNATEAHKQQLDQWLQALGSAGQPAQSAQSPGGTADPGAGSPTGGTQPAGPDGGATPGPATGSDGSASGGPTSSAQGGAVPQELKALGPDIQNAASKTGLSQTEISAVIWDESRGKAGAATTNGGNGLTDAGLMQMNPATFGSLQAKHPELQGKSLADPSTQILAGSYFLADLKKQFGSTELAERAYNSGEGSVDKSDPNKTTTGLGDPNYIQKLASIKSSIEGGKPLFA